jgi:hypothetical protein
MRELAASKIDFKSNDPGNIGRDALDNLLNETFAAHPHFPGTGAETILNALITNSGRRLSERRTGRGKQAGQSA